MRSTLKKELTWDVKSQPLVSLMGLETNRKVNIRNDNNEQLAVVSKNYQNFTNRQLLKLCKGIERLGKFHLEGFEEFRGGKIVMAFIRNNQPGLKLAGLELKEHLVIGNSFDASHQMFIGSSHVLCRCENQFSSIVPMRKIRHLAGSDFSKQTLELIKTTYEYERKRLYHQLESLKSKKITQKLMDDMIVYLLDTDKEVPDDQRKKELIYSYRGQELKASIIQETNDVGMNAFGLFNGVTWYTSHELRSTVSNYGNTHGIARELNQKALQFCTIL